MDDLTKGFEELNADELESIEGGFIFSTLLGATSTLFRGVSDSVSDTLDVVAPVAYLLDRKTEAMHGLFLGMSGLFRPANGRSR